MKLLPKIAPEIAAQRQREHLQRRADFIAHRIDELLFEAVAKTGAVDAAIAQRGRICQEWAWALTHYLAALYIEIHALTDYTFPTDRASSDFRARLQALARTAEAETARKAA